MFLTFLDSCMSEQGYIFERLNKQRDVGKIFSYVAASKKVGLGFLVQLFALGQGEKELI